MVTVDSSSSSPNTGKRRFFLYTTIAMAIVVFVGFSRTFYLRLLFPEAQEFAPKEPIFLVHGAVFTAWMVWLIGQALLIRQRHFALHRTMGWAGAVIAVAMVTLGTYGAIVAAGRPGGFIGVPLPPQQFLIIPVTGMVFFGTMVAMAVAWRARPQHHKRLMLLATVNLLEAAFIRFPLEFITDNAPLTTFGPALLFVVALGIYDRRTMGRIHPVTLWGGIAIALSLPVAFVVSGNAPWLSIAAWLMGGN